MFLPAPPLSDPEPDDAEPLDARTARQLRELEDMIALGMEMLRAFGRQVAMETEAMAAGGPPVEARSRESTALAFFRVSRAVRLSQMLERQLYATALEEPEPEPAPQEMDARAKEMAERVKRRFRLLTRRGEVKSFLERAIETEARERGDGFDRDQAERELTDAVERGDTSEEVWLWRPLGELAEGLCHTLGVRYDPELWTEAGFDDEDGPRPAHLPARGPIGAGRPPPGAALRDRAGVRSPPPFWADDA